MWYYTTDTDPYRITLTGPDAYAVAKRMAKEVPPSRVDYSGPVRMYFETQSLFAKAVDRIQKQKQ